MGKGEIPEVWVGCIACYNEGALVGAWFGADEIPTTEPDWLDAMLAQHSTVPTDHTSWSHEEIWCFDLQGWGGLIQGETSPADAARVWSVVWELAEEEREAFGLYVADQGGDVDSVRIDQFRDAYCGRWDSMEEYAEELFGDLYDLRDNPLTNYVDWERVARDLTFDGYFTADASEYRGVHVFRAV